MHAAGEINTLQGNLNWVASREHSLTNPVWKGREEELLPLCNGAESDSANLDHVAELLMRTGTPAEESLMILVPEAYDNHPDLQKHYPEVRAAPSVHVAARLLSRTLLHMLRVAQSSAGHSCRVHAWTGFPSPSSRTWLSVRQWGLRLCRDCVRLSAAQNLT